MYGGRYYRSGKREGRSDFQCWANEGQWLRVAVRVDTVLAFYVLIVTQLTMIWSYNKTVVTAGSQGVKTRML